MSRNKSVLTLAVISAAAVLSLLAASCGTKSLAYVTPPLGPSTTSATTSSTGIVPFLPPSYYQCTSVLPIDLENAFFGLCWSDPNADANDDGQVFVFKDMIVDAWMIRDVDSGWLWADVVKCPVINIDDARKLAPGDHLDIVGICVGMAVNQDSTNYLVFENCYVLQADSVQLPAPGEGGAFTANY